MKNQIMDKYFEIKIVHVNGAVYRQLIYINDNTVKYSKPLTHQTNEAFFQHALKMIGWV